MESPVKIWINSLWKELIRTKNVWSIKRYERQISEKMHKHGYELAKKPAFENKKLWRKSKKLSKKNLILNDALRK